MNRLIWHGDREYRRIAKRAPAITNRIAEAIAARAQELAPVKSGTLKSSIHASGNKVVADADHASAVELGTATRAAQPFMRPACEQFNETDLKRCLD